MWYSFPRSSRASNSEVQEDKTGEASVSTGAPPATVSVLARFFLQTKPNNPRAPGSGFGFDYCFYCGFRFRPGVCFWCCFSFCFCFCVCFWWRWEDPGSSVSSAGTVAFSFFLASLPCFRASPRALCFWPLFFLFLGARSVRTKRFLGNRALSKSTTARNRWSGVSFLCSLALLLLPDLLFVCNLDFN